MSEPKEELPKTVCPSTKTIIWPTWRDTNEHIICIDQILGAFAMWAIRQSPYNCPDHLETAIKILAEKLIDKGDFDMDIPDFQYTKLNIDSLRDLINECFKDFKILDTWNTPKKGDPGEFVFVSRYHSLKPDYDFIGIDALAQNIVHTIIRESVVEAEVPKKSEVA